MKILKQQNNIRWVETLEQFKIGKYLCIKKQIKFENENKKGDWLTEHVQLLQKVGE